MTPEPAPWGEKSAEPGLPLPPVRMATTAGPTSLAISLIGRDSPSAFETADSVPPTLVLTAATRERIAGSTAPGGALAAAVRALELAAAAPAPATTADTTQSSSAVVSLT